MNYELNRPQTKEKNKKVIGVMKDEKAWKNLLDLLTYNYLKDDDSKVQKKQIDQRSVIKRIIKLADYKTVKK